jgi:hypothetical protein
MGRQCFVSFPPTLFFYKETPDSSLPMPLSGKAGLILCSSPVTIRETHAECPIPIPIPVVFSARPLARIEPTEYRAR